MREYIIGWSNGFTMAICILLLADIFDFIELNLK